ncbi:MAG: DUF192 domain-containing protein [Geobacteraceae bacterium]|nr:DUF192 domain-containing protein [Geobacteraceae bacterium]
MKAINSTSHEEIAGSLGVAETIFSRMKGLLGRNSMAEGEGLLIRPCKGIHTFGMRFPIDVVFLDKTNRVIAVTKSIPPNHMTRMYLGASSAIELPAGILEKTATKIGDEVEFA